MGARSPLGLILACLTFVFCLAASQAEAQTRRAFLVGVQDYTDGYINPLRRAVNDAKDLGKDLEDAGFDKKNIKIVSDVRNKDAFDKEFDAFLKTVQPGDLVLFFFSGHGFGVEVDQNNYLLFTELKSPFTYARSQLNDPERRNPDIVRLRIPSFLDTYQRVEIPQSGVAATEIERKLAERNPKTVIMILDACRSLVKPEPEETKLIKRSPDTGSRLLTNRRPPPGFFVMYSASFGEQALESVSNSGRNSLFTEVLRTEVLRPGQSLVELGDRVKLMVRAIAQDFRNKQEPEIVDTTQDSFDILLVGSIGRERFPFSQDPCAGDKADWDQIKNLRKRDLLERHRRRFNGCGTAEAARRELAQLALSSDDPVDPPRVAVNRSINECDLLGASELDFARPAEVPGVPFEKMDFDAAIAACSKAVTDSPRTARFQFNLGRAYHRRAIEPGIERAERTRALRSAFLTYEDAVRRGYVSALNDLAVMYEIGDGVERNPQMAVELLKRGAEQGHPLAMYNLGIRYRYARDVKRDWSQAYELFAKAAETGFVPAMVEFGAALVDGLPINNPRRGVEWLQRAADAGSTRAKFLLGKTYYYGSEGDTPTTTVQEDEPLALLWFGRMGESADSTAKMYLALLMQSGKALSSPQPESAERYWRLAAYGGDEYAQVTLADKMRHGFLLAKEEFGSREAVEWLERALSQGSAQAALALAQIRRNGELGQDKSPVEAMKYAYRAIHLATLSDSVLRQTEPFPEVAAAHLLAEMAKNGEATDAAGRPLITQDEIDRLEKFYGIVDPVTRQVKIRRLTVTLNCGVNRQYNPATRTSEFTNSWTKARYVWVWDWGRTESPTEFQFRNLERGDRACTDNRLLRRTLIDIFEQSKKSKVAYADLVDQKVKTAHGQSVETTVTRSPRRGRRHRRW